MIGGGDEGLLPESKETKRDRGHPVGRREEREVEGEGSLHQLRVMMTSKECYYGYRSYIADSGQEGLQ